MNKVAITAVLLSLVSAGAFAVVPADKQASSLSHAQSTVAVPLTKATPHHHGRHHFSRHGIKHDASPAARSRAVGLK